MTILSYNEFILYKKNKNGLIFFTIVLIILAGIRVGQGADYWPYLNLYTSINKFVAWNKIFSSESGVEPTYVLLSKIYGSLSLPFTAILFSFAALSLTLKLNIFYKYSPLPMLSLIYYFIPSYFIADSGQIRQGLAISICIFSFKYIEQKELFKYLLCMLICYWTHKTSIVFFPAYWIANAKISTIKAFYIIIISLILWPLKPYLIIGETLNSMSSDNIASESFNSYEGMNEAELGLSEIIKILLITIIFFNDKYIINSNVDENYMKVRNLVIFYFFIYYSFHGNAIFSIRLPGAYGAFDSILISMIVCYSRSKNFYYLYFTIYLYLLSYRFWNNAQSVGFDKIRTIFNDPRFSIYYFTPQEFYKNINDIKPLN